MEELKIWLKFLESIPNPLGAPNNYNNMGVNNGNLSMLQNTFKSFM
jgi:hypothetical protein